MAQTEMRHQLDMKDMNGMTVLMHAANSRNISVVGVVLGKIKLSQVTGTSASGSILILLQRT